MIILGLYYNEADPTFNMLGSWGDKLDVKLLVMDDADVAGTNFRLSGSFQVVSVASFGVTP